MNDARRGFDFLRVSLEAHLSGPSILAVTSARADDGADIVASGLAQAFVAAGRPTLLVTTGIDPAAAVRSTPSGEGVRLARSMPEQLTAGMPGGRSDLVAAVRALRERYGIVLIDAEALPGSARSFELARAADAVLVSIRLGRRPCDEDRTTMKLLGDAGANVLGVVPTNVRATARAAEAAAATHAHDDGSRRIVRPLEARVR